MYRILYFTWGENSRKDCVSSLWALGHFVTVWQQAFSGYTRDEAFQTALREKLREGFDAVFSFNYFPMLSEGARDAGILYLSWVYDSPHLTLQSLTLGNPGNRVFVFDYSEAQRLCDEGFDTVQYLPLAVNVARMEKQTRKCRGRYLHDVTFLGSLYCGEADLYSQIGYLPEYLKGFLDGIIRAQQELYGLDLAGELMPDSLCEELQKYVKAELGPDYRPCGKEILRNMVRKRVTTEERIHLLSLLGERFSVDLYSGKKPEEALPVKFLGYADYVSQMPEIFAASKINLNISLRSILTGIPLRVVDILGAGGFCLTNYQAEMPEYFENGKELVWFEGKEDLLDLTEYYLTHDAEREQIAEAGHRIAAERFSYEVLLTRLLDGAFH